MLAVAGIFFFKNAGGERVKVSTLSLKFLYAFFVFSYSSSFPIKMLATDAKTQKIEPGPNCFILDKSFEGSV